MLRYEIVKSWLESRPVVKAEKNMEATHREWMAASRHCRTMARWAKAAMWGPMPRLDTKVTSEDSLCAGNCEEGTLKWAKVYFPGRTEVTVREVIKNKEAFNRQFVRAARYARARENPEAAAKNLARARKAQEEAGAAVEAAHHKWSAAVSLYDDVAGNDSLRTTDWLWSKEEPIAKLGLGEIDGCSSWQIAVGKAVGLARNHRWFPGCIRGMTARKTAEEFYDYLTDGYAGKWWHWDEESRALIYKSGSGCTKVTITPERATVVWDEGPLHMRACMEAGGDPNLIGKIVDMRFHAKKLVPARRLRVSCWDEEEIFDEYLSADFGGKAPIKLRRTASAAVRRAASAALAVR